MGRSVWGQLVALTRKNWILKKRQWLSTVFEVALPVLFIFSMVALRGAVDIEDKDTQIHDASAVDDVFFKSLSEPSVLFNMSAFMNITGRIIGISPRNNATEALADRLAAVFGLLGDKRVRDSRIRFFESDSAFADFTQSPTYGSHDVVRCPWHRDFGKPDGESEQYPLDQRCAPEGLENNRALAAFILVEESPAGIVWPPADDRSDSGSPQPTAPAATPADDAPPPVWSYTLRLNNSDFVPDDFWLPMAPSTLIPGKFPLQIGYNDHWWKRYHRQGFVFLQTVIERFILEQHGAAQPATQFHELVRPFPTPAYRDDVFVNLVKAFLGLFMTLVFIWPVTRIVRELVQEKEWRIREGMKIMGLRDRSLWLSWLLLYLALMGLIAALITLVTAGTMYEHSDKSLVFAFYFLFAMNAFAFSFLVSVFFSRGSVATTMGALLFFGSFLPYFSVDGDTDTRGTKLLGCASAPICFGLGVVHAAEFEAAQRGVHWDDLSSELYNISFGDVMLMLVIDFVGYMLLALYLDKVVPGKYGRALPWNFCCRALGGGQSRGARLRQSAAFASSSASAAPALDEDYEQHDGVRVASTGRGEHAFAPSATSSEAASWIWNDRVQAHRSGRVGVLATHLKKEFTLPNGSKVAAVGDFSIDMYEGEIFALLGHNGAGKTTTINMLTGMYSVSDGDATIFGERVSSDLRELREFTGFCPQHDVIFPLLTVREHVALYAAIKGADPAEGMREGLEMVEQLGLAEKLDSMSGSLSGGQKRKLSVTIALMGGSKMVFLDEPTSGMDPYSRRATWELIKAHKKDRVIVLTTHFMDEADQLGDRIAIMSGGEVRCCGTSLFLKNLYGVGYTFTCSLAKSAGGNTMPLQQLVAQHVPESTVLSEAAGEIAFRLPFAASKDFPDLFDALDARLAAMGVSAYGISVTTLEEVFLRVGRGERVLDADSAEVKRAQKAIQKRMDEAKRRRSSAGGAGAPLLQSEAGITAEASLFLNETPSKVTATRQFWALLVKRWHNAKRDPKVWTWQMLYPFLITVLSVWLVTSANEISAPKRALTTETFDAPSIVPVVNFSTPGDGYGAEPLFDFFKSELELPVVDNRVNSSDTMAAYLLATRGAQRRSRYGAFAFQKVPVGPPVWRNNTYDNDTRCDGHPRADGRCRDWSAGPAFPYEATVFHNTTARDTLPVFLNRMRTSWLRHALGQPRAEIRMATHPMPFTENERTLTTAVVAVLLSIGFAFVPASYVAYVVKERASKAKLLQIVSGVSTTSYWVSTFAWDILNYLVPAALLIVSLSLFDLWQLTQGDNLQATALLALSFGVAVTPFSYVMSFLFDNESTAQAAMLLFNIATGAVLLIVSMIMSIIPSLSELDRNLRHFYRLLPPFAFGEGLGQLIIRQNRDIWGVELAPLHWKITGRVITFLWIECVVYFVAVLVIEKINASPLLSMKVGEWLAVLEHVVKLRWLLPKKQKQQRSTQHQDPENSDPGAQFENDDALIDAEAEATAALEDDDVRAERQRVLSGSSEADGDIVVLKSLRKVWPSRYGARKKIAVKDMCFGVPEGQIFGFLGVNGAGKTTTLQMLTGDALPSSGTAQLGGLDILERQEDVRQLMGYCPQFDALIDTLTAEEHLTLYARFKGVSEHLIPKFVADMVDELGLTDFADKPAGGYSGGNKRKLSVGLALIGDPQIVFLDEPSTGMDPKARRGMWELLANTMAGRSVILTTHSMEECEALCQSIGIMVNGRLRCKGSAPHLKGKYGTGYMFDVNCSDQDASPEEESARVAALDRWVHETFGGNAAEAAAAGQEDPLHPHASTTPTLLEQHGAHVKYRLPRGQRSIGDVFRIVEEARRQVNIREYSLSETSLEQIFITFAKEQEVDDRSHHAH